MIEVLDEEIVAALRSEDETWLLFRCPLPPDMGDVLETAALAHIDRRGYEFQEWGPNRVEVGFTMRVDCLDDDLLPWLHAVADGLTARGLAGSVAVAHEDFPDWPSGPPGLGTYLAYQDAATRPPGGEPSPVVSTVLDLLRFPGSDGYLVLQQYTCRALATADQLVTDSLRRYHSCTARFGRRDPYELAFATFESEKVVLIRHDPALAWEQRLQRAVADMVGARAGADLGFVRREVMVYPSWGSISESSARRPRMLTPDTQREHVADADGAMLLTDAHLRRARDLSGWSVEPLGDGQHLVLAADLAAWYATAVPDPAVVEQARRDLGGMLLP